MKKISTIKKSVAFLLLAFGISFSTFAQGDVLWTGEKTPEAITYFDFPAGWIKGDGVITSGYVNFGTAEAPAYSSIVDNPDKAGINKTDKALILKSLKGKSWWPDFFQFTLGAPVSITENNRYLHIYHYRQNLNQGYSVNINQDTPWGDGDKGTKRFDGQLSKAGQWEDIVIDLKWYMDNAEPLSKICILMDRNWGGGAQDPTDYYFDEVVLNGDNLQRGVVLLPGTDLLNCQDQPQIDELTFDTQNAANTYSIVDNPFTTSTVNEAGKIIDFFKSADASWWQGMKVTFPGIHKIEYGTKQFLHVLVRADIACDIQLQVIDNADGDRTEIFPYPAEVVGEWFDLVWDLSSYAAIKSFAVRFDVRKDGEGNWINGTPAGHFYMDEITLDGNADQREKIILPIAQDVLWTGEKTPEAITYFDFPAGWIKGDGVITSGYVNFGTAEAPAYSSIVDNPEKAGINKTNKALILKSLKGKSWWPDFFQFTLGAPVSITENNRYLHIYHYRQNLNQGYSVNINQDTPWGDGDKGTKRFDGQLSKAGQWEDIVIDLKWYMDNAEPLSKICILMDRNWGGGAQDPTDYYFDEVVLSADYLPRGVVILPGTNLLSCQSQSQIDALTFDTQNAANTYSIVDNPFTTSTVNATGKIIDFFKSADASWWQGMKITFPGIHMIEYGTKQYLHVLVRADIACDIQLQVIDNADGDRTEMFPYPAEVVGEWFDLVWDLSSYAAIKSFTVRFDVRKDGEGNWINGTPAGHFYMDEITLDGNADQREVIITGLKPSINKTDLKAYTTGRTIYFSLPDASRVAVYDMVGKNVASQNLSYGAHLNAIPVSNSGMYILKVETKSGKVYTTKLVVK